MHQHVSRREDGLDMDVFKIDQSLSANLGSAPPPDKLNADVSFDAGSEFNLSFFDQPEDSAQGFSDPGSVGSTSVSSPPPPTPPHPQPLVLQQPSVSVTNSQGLITFTSSLTSQSMPLPYWLA